MTKHQLLILFSALFFSCSRNHTNENIEFNGLKDINSTYKVKILISEGKGSKFIISEKISSEFELDLNLRDYDSLKYKATISRLKYEYGNHSLFKYIFDTDIDTVAIMSDYMELEFKDDEKKKVNEALDVLKKIKGKSTITAFNEEGVLKLEKNEISTKDYFFNSHYNPEKKVEKILNPSDLLILFDFVFYPELGSYTKGKQYQIKGENDSLTFVYKNGKITGNILYLEQRFRANEYRRVESKIDIKSNTILESKFTERIKKERDIIGIYTILEKEIVVQKIN